MDNGLTVYAPFIKEIKELIYRHQYDAMKKVNTELLQLYWEIGGEIEQKQREQGWGKSETNVDYTLKSSNAPIGVTTYSFHENMPENMRSLLPSPDEIAKIVRAFDDDSSGIGLLGLAGDGIWGEDDDQS